MAEKKPIKNLEELFVDMLKDLYSAETQITKALPKMIDKANHQDLKMGFQEHLEVTEGQVGRLEKIFKELKKSPEGKTCVGMQGLLKEGTEIMKEAADPNVMDAGLIAAAQKVEHYEISSYGTARTYAIALCHQNFVQALEMSLEEEAQADKKLIRLAEGHINRQAKG